MNTTSSIVSEAGDVLRARAHNLREADAQLPWAKSWNLALRDFPSFAALVSAPNAQAKVSRTEAQGGLQAISDSWFAKNKGAMSKRECMENARLHYPLLSRLAGKLEDVDPDSDDGDDDLIECPSCKGKGTTSDGWKCMKCNGTGKVKPDDLDTDNDSDGEDDDDDDADGLKAATASACKLAAQLGISKEAAMGLVFTRDPKLYRKYLEQHS